jgi:hypothetical protein
MKGVPEHIRRELKERVFADVDQCRCALRRQPGMFTPMTFKPTWGRPWLMRWMQWTRGGEDEPDFRRYVVTDRRGEVYFGEWCYYEHEENPEDECVIFMPGAVGGGYE